MAQKLSHKIRSQIKCNAPIRHGGVRISRSQKKMWDPLRYWWTHRHIVEVGHNICMCRTSRFKKIKRKKRRWETIWESDIRAKICSQMNDGVGWSSKKVVITYYTTGLPKLSDPHHKNRKQRQVFGCGRQWSNTHIPPTYGTQWK